MDRSDRRIRLRVARLAMGGALAWSSAIVRGDEPKPTTAPATTAPAAAPAPSPKAVALAFAAALEKGDAAAAAGLLSSDEPHAKWVEATIALAASLKKLDAAALARFNEPQKPVSQNQLHLIDSFKALEQAQEKVEGEAATLTMRGQAEPLRLKRVEGKWVLLIAPDGEAGRRQCSLYQRLTQAATQTAEEIAAGAYPDAETAARVFGGRVLEARLKV